MAAYESGSAGDDYASLHCASVLFGYWIGKRTLEVAQHAVTCILIRQNSLVCGYTPINTKTFVQYAYTIVCRRMIEVIALILEYSPLAQYSKTMSKTFGNKELPMILT